MAVQQGVTRLTQTTSRATSATPAGDATTTRTSRSVEAAPPRSVLAARIVYYFLGVIEVLLALRFVLALLGANRANPFANFIFAASYPFAAPFFSLFGYQPTYGSSQLEMGTLIAMAVYALIAWGVVKLIRLPRPASGDEV